MWQAGVVIGQRQVWPQATGARQTGAVAMAVKDWIGATWIELGYPDWIRLSRSDWGYPDRIGAIRIGLGLSGSD